MSPSFDFTSVDRFITGAVGTPGNREFHIQVIDDGRATSFKLEKQQVAMLAEHLARLLDTYELPEVSPAHMGDLDEPLHDEWSIGSMMVAINEEVGRVIVICEELEIQNPDDPEVEQLGDDDDDDSGAEVRISLTRDQVEAFVAGARHLIEAGRPICRLCGGPMDPEGHACPRWN
jgi:uncharacterized repeat protein (TIGR03847 family)